MADTAGAFRARTTAETAEGRSRSEKRDDRRRGFRVVTGAGTCADVTQDDARVVDP